MSTATQPVSEIDPELSARSVFSVRRRIFAAFALAVVAMLFAQYPWQSTKTLVVFSTFFYLIFSAYKLLLVHYAVAAGSEMEVAPGEIAALTDEGLPVYSVLVPLYHEADSVPTLVKALGDLDYPAAKLDVQLLLEEDDEATRHAVEVARIPAHFRVTLVPPSEPRTKPKACNVGLAQAMGRFLVIYDAEDRPEPDQLKKAVVAFLRHTESSRLMCLQCKLNFYNPRQNLLTRWFAAEYSSWFDLALPGLSALRAVIPLGGTSNHFITAALRELGGWDPYNVTEDCDLGIRLCRAGYFSRMLDATTWEEACSSLRFWIRQRTRWLKGYIQTYLVHMRRPVKLAREIGVANFVHFNLLVGGIVLCFLLNPVFWFLAIFWFGTRSDALTALFPGYVFALGALCLFAGNFAFVYCSMLGCFKRRYFDLVKYALLSPFYWALMSLAGWRAVLQVFSSPFYWEKTEHGKGIGHCPPKADPLLAERLKIGRGEEGRGRAESGAADTAATTTRA